MSYSWNSKALLSSQLLTGQQGYPNWYLTMIMPNGYPMELVIGALEKKLSGLAIYTPQDGAEIRRILKSAIDCVRELKYGPGSLLVMGWCADNKIVRVVVNDTYVKTKLFKMAIDKAVRFNLT